MKRFLLFLLTCIWSVVAVKADVTDIIHTTDVPLLDIKTVDGETPSCEYVSAPDGCWGKGIINATKVPARMVMTLRGDTIYDSGDYAKGESGLTIKIRGNTSAYKQKKGYKLKLQKKSDLLQRGDDKYFKDKDWVLLATQGLYYSVGFWLGEALGQEWTPGSELVAVRLNDDYLGLYNLTEQVKADNGNRVHIDEEDGYMIEADTYWWTEDRWFDSAVTSPQMKYTFKYPDPEDITESQFQYVKEDMERIEATVLDGTFESTISCHSFARWMIGWDILGGFDAGGGNMFLVKKDSDSPLEMGPMWDFDCIMQNPDKWSTVHSQAFWYATLFNSPCGAFRKSFVDIWNSKGHEAISIVKERISYIIDSDIMTDLAKILTMEYTDIKDCDGNEWYKGEIDGFIEERDNYFAWLEDREDWISAHIGVYDEDSYTQTVSIGQEAPVYFDLQGHKLSNPPTDGIYLERRGNFVRKKTAAYD